jgi:catechol 2,3-dioxygenase-like lactoylglutathione lyase family enzyme
MKLDLISIVVNDIPRSLEFYRLLGWNIPEAEVGEKHIEIILESGLRFAWDDLEMMRSFDPSASIQPHTVGAFLCASPEEVNQKYEKLVAAGHHGHLAPWDAVWGQRYAVIHDPDGHAIDLFAEL